VDAPRNAVTVSQHVFDRISRRTNPDGVAVIAKTPYLGIDTFSPPSPVLTVVADGIEKPGNIGAMLRTCDALGAAFIASELGTDVVNPNVVRAAQGSLFATPTALVDRATAVAWCTANSQVLVLRPDATAKVWDIDLTRPTSIVVGAEHDGVGAEWDGVGTGVSIPMVGIADSLNTSISAAIVIAEANRQRST
jgi:TrmH family RNA methyltransferase